MHVGHVRDHRGDVVDGLDVAVELAVAGVVRDLHPWVGDAREQRQRLGAARHDVTVDLERDVHARLLAGVGKGLDVGQEGAFVLVLAGMAADGGVHYGQPVVGAPLHRLDAVGQAIRCGEVGMAREHDRFQAVVRKARPQLPRICIEVDVLGPALDGGQLDAAIARLGDARERLLAAVGVERVRVPRQRVAHLEPPLLIGVRVLHELHQSSVGNHPCDPHEAVCDVERAEYHLVSRERGIDIVDAIRDVRFVPNRALDGRVRLVAQVLDVEGVGTRVCHPAARGLDELLALVPLFRDHADVVEARALDSVHRSSAPWPAWI
jgi:hypothetical protein